MTLPSIGRANRLTAIVAVAASAAPQTSRVSAWRGSLISRPMLRWMSIPPIVAPSAGG
jgi:hypothetical protein